ncbi:MAG: menaquinone biosynthesis protein [Candidatus Latescibacteria bacterium]|nr:menaquinone biosynthesis protein [Candidatus Latescibacterota bacterium]
MPTRLSAVSYLNSRPLVLPLAQRRVPHDFEIAYDVPSVCATKLKRGEADVGIIPSIEYARSAVPYWIVPDISISSRGPVQSILLFHTVPFDRIRTVALDSSSRTSAALAQIILRDRYGLIARYIDHPPVLDEMLAVADAALVIGDNALDYTDRPEPRRDLGLEWFAMTGRPFVYAFWAGREDALDSIAVDSLIRAKEVGMTLIRQIAAEHAASHPGSSAFYESYLRDHLQYPLGPDELAGLMEFYERAHRLGLIEAIPAIRFYERAVTSDK